MLSILAGDQTSERQRGIDNGQLKCPLSFVSWFGENPAGGTDQTIGAHVAESYGQWSKVTFTVVGSAPPCKMSSGCIPIPRVWDGVSQCVVQSMAWMVLSSFDLYQPIIIEK